MQLTGWLLLLYSHVIQFLQDLYYYLFEESFKSAKIPQEKYTASTFPLISSDEVLESLGLSDSKYSENSRAGKHSYKITFTISLSSSGHDLDGRECQEN